MPVVDPGVARTTATSVQSQIMDVRGKVRTASIVVSPDATALSIGLIHDAIGNATNGAQLSRNSSSIDEVINPLADGVVFFDESYSTTEQVAVFYFQDDSGEVRTLELPAPDLSMFLASNREIIDPGNTRALAIITAVEGALNAGDPAGTFTYSRGYLATRRSSRARTRTVPGVLQIVEPGVGELPGEAPGV